MQQLVGDVLCLAAQCLQKVVVILRVIRNTGSPEPAGHRSAATSQQQPQNDREKYFRPLRSRPLVRISHQSAIIVGSVHAASWVLLRGENCSS